MFVMLVDICFAAGWSGNPWADNFSTWRKLIEDYDPAAQVRWGWTERMQAAHTTMLSSSATGFGDYITGWSHTGIGSLVSIADNEEYYYAFVQTEWASAGTFDSWFGRKDVNGVVPDILPIENVAHSIEVSGFGYNEAFSTDGWGRVSGPDFAVPAGSWLLYSPFVEFRQMIGAWTWTGTNRGWIQTGKERGPGKCPEINSLQLQPRIFYHLMGTNPFVSGITFNSGSDARGDRWPEDAHIVDKTVTLTSTNVSLGEYIVWVEIDPTESDGITITGNGANIGDIIEVAFPAGIKTRTMTQGMVRPNRAYVELLDQAQQASALLEWTWANADWTVGGASNQASYFGQSVVSWAEAVSIATTNIRWSTSRGYPASRMEGDYADFGSSNELWTCDAFARKGRPLVTGLWTGTNYSMDYYIRTMPCGADYDDQGQGFTPTGQWFYAETVSGSGATNLGGWFGTTDFPTETTEPTEFVIETSKGYRLRDIVRVVAKWPFKYTE